jgi:hypothetical protein
MLNTARVVLLAGFALGAVASGQAEVVYHEISKTAQPLIQPLIDRTSIDSDQKQGSAF